MISSYYSYNIHNNMLLFVSHYPDFQITSCINAFENYVQSIVLYGLKSSKRFSRQDRSLQQCIKATAVALHLVRGFLIDSHFGVVVYYHV